MLCLALRVFVYGALASGKSSLSAALAKKSNGIDLSAHAIIEDARNDGDGNGAKVSIMIYFDIVEKLLLIES